MSSDRPARYVRSIEDVLELLDSLFEASADRWSAERGGAWWDGFYQDRSKPVPFFDNKPDENLVSYLERGLLSSGRALDLGCGAGRNALYLAGRGFTVDAIDLSARAIEWAKEHADQVRHAEERVTFHCGDALGAAGQELVGGYDLVYDSGCLHHVPPHRRVGYLQLLDRLLVPGGHFGLVCFLSAAMGSEVADEQLYSRGGLEGGLAFTPDALRWIFHNLAEVELRPMHAQGPSSALFGEPFLLTALFRREDH